MRAGTGCSASEGTSPRGKDQPGVCSGPQRADLHRLDKASPTKQGRRAGRGAGPAGPQGMAVSPPLPQLCPAPAHPVRCGLLTRARCPLAGHSGRREARNKARWHLMSESSPSSWFRDGLGCSGPGRPERPRLGDSGALRPASSPSCPALARARFSVAGAWWEQFQRQEPWLLAAKLRVASAAG